MGCVACTEPQCLYKGALYPFFFFLTVYVYVENAPIFQISVFMNCVECKEQKLQRVSCKIPFNICCYLHLVRVLPGTKHILALVIKNNHNSSQLTFLNDSDFNTYVPFHLIEYATLHKL